MAVIKWIFLILWVSVIRVLVRKGLYGYLEDFERRKKDDTD